MKQHFLILVPEDPQKKPQLKPFHQDVGAAVAEFTRLRQAGGPDGFGEAILTSNTTLHRRSKIYSVAAMKKQAEVAVEANELQLAEQTRLRAKSLMRNLSEINAELDSIRSTGLVPELAVTAPDVPAPAGSTEDNDPGKSTGDQTSLLTPGSPEV